jgi:hypothetical protein
MKTLTGDNAQKPNVTLSKTWKKLTVTFIVSYALLVSLTFVALKKGILDKGAYSLVEEIGIYAVVIAALGFIIRYIVKRVARKEIAASSEAMQETRTAKPIVLVNFLTILAIILMIVQAVPKLWEKHTGQELGFIKIVILAACLGLVGGLIGRLISRKGPRQAKNA